LKQIEHILGTSEYIIDSDDLPDTPRERLLISDSPEIPYDYSDQHFEIKKKQPTFFWFAAYDENMANLQFKQIMGKRRQNQENKNLSIEIQNFDVGFFKKGTKREKLFIYPKFGSTWMVKLYRITIEQLISSKFNGVNSLDFVNYDEQEVLTQSYLTLNPYSEYSTILNLGKFEGMEILTFTNHDVIKCQKDILRFDLYSKEIKIWYNGIRNSFKNLSDSYIILYICSKVKPSASKSEQCALLSKLLISQIIDFWKTKEPTKFYTKNKENKPKNSSKTPPITTPSPKPSPFQHSLTCNKPTPSSSPHHVPSVPGPVHLSFTSMLPTPSQPPQDASPASSILPRIHVVQREEDALKWEEVLEEMSENVDGFAGVYSERFGGISEIEGDPRGEEDEGFEEFIRLGKKYEDMGEDLDMDFWVGQAFTEDSRAEDMSIDEEWRPNHLPSIKKPKKGAFKGSDIAQERCVFETIDNGIDRKVIKKQPTIRRSKPKDYIYPFQTQETLSNMIKQDACFSDDGYFTFRRISFKTSEQFQSSTISSNSIQDHLTRLRITTPTNPEKISVISRFGKVNRTPESLWKMSPMLKRSSPSTLLHNLPKDSMFKQSFKSSRNLISRQVTPSATKEICRPKVIGRNLWIQKRTETLSISSSILGGRKKGKKMKREDEKRVRLEGVKQMVLQRLRGRIDNRSYNLC
jgi:hypothetical protein